MEDLGEFVGKSQECGLSTEGSKAALSLPLEYKIKEQLTLPTTTRAGKS